MAGSAVVGGGRSGNAISTSGGSGARMESPLVRASAWLAVTGQGPHGSTICSPMAIGMPCFGGHAADNQLIIEAGSNRLGVFDNALGFRPSGYDLVPASNSGWNHVAAVGSGTTTTFYRNGVFVGTADRKSVTNIFTVGAFAGGSQRFAQLIDDVYIYQSALTPTQIMSLYNSGAGTAANSIPDSSTVTIASGAFLDLNGSSETIGNSCLRRHRDQRHRRLSHVDRRQRQWQRQLLGRDSEWERGRSAWPRQAPARRRWPDRIFTPARWLSTTARW